jgi:outer membrane protein
MNKYLLTICFVLVLIISYLGYSRYRQDKLGYVMNAELFEKYKGKKDMEKNLLDFQNKNRAFFDSLTLELKLQQNKLRKGEVKNEEDQAAIIQSKVNNYTRLYQEFQEENNKRTEEFETQTWNQINQYLKEFGKEKHYTIIYGATGNGSLMYADESKDLTKEVIEFINKKYEGR